MLANKNAYFLSNKQHNDNLMVHLKLDEGDVVYEYSV